MKQSAVLLSSVHQSSDRLDTLQTFQYLNLQLFLKVSLLLVVVVVIAKSSGGMLFKVLIKGIRHDIPLNLEAKDEEHLMEVIERFMNGLFCRQKILEIIPMDPEATSSTRKYVPRIKL